jgi:hypothetical protein
MKLSYSDNKKSPKSKGFKARLQPFGVPIKDVPKMAVFWVVAPYSLVEVYQRFRGPCCLSCLSTQKTAIFGLTAVRTSNPKDVPSACKHVTSDWMNGFSSTITGHFAWRPIFFSSAWKWLGEESPDNSQVIHKRQFLANAPQLLRHEYIS